MSFKIIYRLHLSKNTRHYSVPRLHLMGELAAAPPLTEGEKPISQNQSKLAVIRNVRYLSFRHRDKSRCHLPFSSRVLLAARDQPGRILRMPVRRCRNPLRGSSVRIIRGRQPHPSACGAAPQSSIEPSAVCLKADRQTKQVCRLGSHLPQGGRQELRRSHGST